LTATWKFWCASAAAASDGGSVEYNPPTKVALDIAREERLERIMESKLIPLASAAVEPPTPEPMPPITAPVIKAVIIPRDVMNAIKREAERDPSDPFMARRLAAHYRSGIWTSADAHK
jgi:hypothetical protein